MLHTLILVVHTLIAIALVAVILLQRSEGGALGVGGGPGGMMSARGAANLLTRTTTWLAVAFISTSIALAVMAGYGDRERAIDTTLARPASAPAESPTPQPADGGRNPLGAPAEDAPLVPLAQ